MPAMKTHVRIAIDRLCGCVLPLGLLASLLAGGPQIALGQARSTDDARPLVGGVISLQDALLVYVVRGPVGACGENCSEWIAVEGTVHWDSHKRMIALLDRLEGRKLPVVVNVRGPSNFGVAISIGRILRDRGIDVSAGRTLVDQCHRLSEADCTAMKRTGDPLTASLSTVKSCDIACVFILAGGLRRTIPEVTTVVIGGIQVAHRLDLNVSDERREGLRVQFREQFRLYLTQMGVDPKLADMIDANYGTSHTTELSRVDLVRLRIVTPQ
jgi:hypothetical protein